MNDKKTIRVLHVITRLEEGGAPRVILDLVERLDESGIDVKIATGRVESGKRDLISLAIKRGIKVEKVPSLTRKINPIRDLRALIDLVWLIRKGGYDIVHCHTSKAGFIGRLAARMNKTKIILYSPHGNIFYGYFGLPSTILYTSLERFAAAFTDKIITLTRGEIHEYLNRRIGDRDQYLFIYNGIPEKFFERNPISLRRKKRRGFGIGPDEKIVTMVGRLEPVKGPGFLIDAIPMILKDVSNTRFLFVGDGSLRGSLEKKIKSFGLASKVDFLGMRDDVADILDIVDLAVCPSLNEGFGLSIVEAMAKKLAVVASNVGGISEVASDGQTGILVPPANPEALKDAIVTLLLDDTLREKMGMAGFRRAKKNFTTPAMVEKTRELYYELLGFNE